MYPKKDVLVKKWGHRGKLGDDFGSNVPLAVLIVIDPRKFQGFPITGKNSHRRNRSTFGQKLAQIRSTHNTNIARTHLTC